MDLIYQYLNTNLNLRTAHLLAKNILLIISFDLLSFFSINAVDSSRFKLIWVDSFNAIHWIQFNTMNGINDTRRSCVHNGSTAVTPKNLVDRIIWLKAELLWASSMSNVYGLSFNRQPNRQSLNSRFSAAKFYWSFVQTESNIVAMTVHQMLLILTLFIERCSKPERGQTVLLNFHLPFNFVSFLAGLLFCSFQQIQYLR